jgi:hypothetical protein
VGDALAVLGAVGIDITAFEVEKDDDAMRLAFASSLRR